MKLIRVALLAPMILLAVPAHAAATEDQEGWAAFGHALSLAQVLMRIAAHTENPHQGFDDVLAGRNTEANRAIAGMLEEATAGMPPEHRSRVASIGKDIAALARKEAAKAPSAPPLSAERALQARRDLNAMGLRYYDPKDFLDAVKRDDLLAVELFVEGRGVNLTATDAHGRSALEIAREKGNRPMAALIARNLPAAR